jgi:hypothetical protein
MKSGVLAENNKETDIIICMSQKEIMVIWEMLKYAAENNKKKTSWKAMTKRFENIPD